MFLLPLEDCCLCYYFRLASWLSFSEIEFCYELCWKATLLCESWKLVFDCIVLFVPLDWAEVKVMSLPPELEVFLGF